MLLYLIFLLRIHCNVCSSLAQVGFLRCRGGFRWTPKGGGGSTANPPKRGVFPPPPLGFHLKTASLSPSPLLPRFVSGACLFAAVLSFPFPLSGVVSAATEIAVLMAYVVARNNFSVICLGEGDKTNPSKRGFSPLPRVCFGRRRPCRRFGQTLPHPCGPYNVVLIALFYQPPPPFHPLWKWC